MEFGIQLRTEHTRSDLLGPFTKAIAFIPSTLSPGISESVVNEIQLEQMEEALRTIPHKLKRPDEEWEALNGASW